MNFEYSPEQIEIIDLVKKFTLNEIIPYASELDQEGKFPLDIMKKAWELGLLNTCIPAEFGGAGFSALDSVLITENLSYGCLGVNTSIMANDLALLPIAIAGSEEQKRKFLTPFTQDFKIASFCLTEPENGSDAAGIKTHFKDAGGCLDHQWRKNVDHQCWLRRFDGRLRHN